MRRILSILIVLTASVSHAQQLTAYFDYKVFNSPEKGPFVETYLHFDGSSLTFSENENKKMQAKVGVTVIFQQDEKIIDYEKLTVFSPETDIGGFPDFIDQRRFSLPSGTYTIEFKLSDMNVTDGIGVDFKQALHVDDFNAENLLSDIELLEAATKSEAGSTIAKSGFDLVPLVSTFFPSEQEELLTYAEFYPSLANPASEKGYVINTYIEKYETGVIQPAYKKVKRATAGEQVVPLLQKFDITALLSGNYNLVIEVRDSENKEIARKRQFFQRANNLTDYNSEELEDLDLNGTFVQKIADADTLDEIIQSMRPIATTIERRMLERDLTNFDIDMKRRFLLSFWRARDAMDPEAAYNEYRLRVEQSNELYSLFNRKGYDTDRGRVFLKYGPPSSLVDRPNEPHTYPYQIWHYYRAGNFSNKRFVFIDRDLLHGNYQLLHSDVPGELNDRTWQAKLEQRTYQRQNADDNKSGVNSWGTKADEFYTNPY